MGMAARGVVVMGKTFALGTLALTMAALAAAGCNDAADTCAHYRNKSFNPMPQNAIDACTKVCEAGDEEACDALETWEKRAEDKALRKAALGVDRPYNRCDARPGSDARAQCERECEQGDTGACLKLGLDREYGTYGVDVDRAAALDYYRQGCAHLEAGHACDTELIAMRTTNGPDRPNTVGESFDCDLERKPEESTESYVQRCAADCWGEQACDRMLVMECLEDPEACERACEAGEGPHCRQVFLMYREGQGVTKNAATAERFRARACELGDQWSCHANQDINVYPKSKPKPLDEVGDGTEP